MFVHCYSKIHVNKTTQTKGDENTLMKTENPNFVDQARIHSNPKENAIPK